jgi:hypothetical protein
MNDAKTRVLAFPDDASVGCLHGRTGPYPYEFHGRFKKEGGVLEDTDNPGWDIIGAAKGEIAVSAEVTVLLEIQPEAGRDLSFLRRLAADDLDAIWLGNTFADDSQLVHLTHLSGLEWLDIQNNGAITDVGLARINDIANLVHLGMHWTRITDSTLEKMSDMERLQYLDIWGCEISETAVTQFKQGHPNCQVRTK